MTLNKFLYYLISFKTKRTFYMKFIKVKNFLKDFDIISEEIKLFSIFETKGRYKTFFGGILSLITFSLCLATSIYFLMQIISRSDPRTYQATQYLDDTEKISFDPSNFFFVLMFWSEKTSLQTNESFISFYANLSTAKNSDQLGTYFFEKCIYEEDFIGLEEILKDFQKDDLENGLCIKKMIVNDTLILKNDSKFIWPYTQHGMESKSTDPIYLEVGATRCLNSVENNYSCLSDDIIDEILSNSEYRLIFIDNYFDSMNYKNPIIRFSQEIVASAGSDITSYNYVDMNNVKINTNDGLIFDNVRTIQSYKYQNNVEIVKKKEDNFIFRIIMEGENSPVFVVRNYVRLQEVLANIGGVFKCLFLLAQFVNYSYNKLKIQRNFLKKVFSNFIFSKDELSVFQNMDQDIENIPEENQKILLGNEERLQKQYNTDFSMSFSNFILNDKH